METAGKAGTNAGGSYTETVTGVDNYTQVDNGNHGTGTYARTIAGSGTYDRTSSGPGATVPTFSDLYAYLWEQTGDPHSGTFSLVRTGTDRYGLLEDFQDVSNTQNGETPGHMNFYPFGDPFVDPFPPLPGQERQMQSMMQPLPRPLPRIVFPSPELQRLIDIELRREPPEMEMMEAGVFPAGAVLRGFAALLARSRAAGTLGAATAAGANARHVVPSHVTELYRVERALVRVLQSNPTAEAAEMLRLTRLAIETFPRPTP